MSLIIFTITFFLMISLVILYKRDSRRMLTGFILSNLILFMMLSITFLAIEYNIRILMLLIGIIIMLTFSFFSIGLIILIIGAILNARVLLKREGRRLSNLFIVFFAIFILLFIFSNKVEPSDNTALSFSFLIFYIRVLFYYCTYTFIIYLISSFIYRYIRIHKKIDYIIILGCGLINGNQVSKLLASRINKGLEIYDKQVSLGHDSKVIFSGGQGSDELISEAQAMANYAVSINNDLNYILEDKSCNTLQNLQYSKALIDNSVSSKTTVFVTNDFHVFRAALIARSIKLDAEGMGSKTAFYYWPNAMLREFVGSVYLQRKFHFRIILIFTILNVSMYIFFKIMGI